MIRLYLWSCRVLFVARGPWVRWAPGLSCALFCFEGGSPPTTRTHSCRENAASRLPPLSCPTHAGHPVHIGLSAQSQASLQCWIARTSPDRVGDGRRATTSESVAPAVFRASRAAGKIAENWFPLGPKTLYGAALVGSPAYLDHLAKSKA